MGKATIVSHDGDGQYSVIYQHNNDALDSLIDKLSSQKLENELYVIPNLNDNITIAQANVATAQSLLNDAIDAWIADKTQEKYDQIVTYTEDLTEHGLRLKEFQDQLEQAEAKALSLLQRIADITAARPDDESVQLWCADLADGSAGGDEIAADTEVGTIELSGVKENGIVIQPAYTGLEVHTPERDGGVSHGFAQTPEAFYYNTAMRPGWQKYTYAYRSGNITTKYGNDTFDVELDEVFSASNDKATIEVNDIGTGANSRTLEGITASYMSCDADAFSENDNVVVKIEYTNFGLASQVRTETIIGFVDNPQSCPAGLFAYYPDPHPMGYWQTVDSDSGTWLMTQPYEFDITDYANAKYKTWRQFIGPKSAGISQFVHWPDGSGTAIYIQGSQVAISPIGGTYYIAAAALTPNNDYILAIFYKSGEGRNIYFGRKTATPELTGALYDVSTDPDGWELSSAYPLSTDAIDSSFNDWHFNQSCTEAVCLYAYTHGALRTPQTTPSSGSSWLSPAATFYNSSWAERLEFDIATPSASTLAGMGIVFTETGDTNGHIIQTIESTGSCGGDFESRTWSHYYAESITGTYQIGVGFDGDTELQLFESGTGNNTATGNATGEEEDQGIPCVAMLFDTYTRTQTGLPLGINYVCSELGFSKPKNTYDNIQNYTHARDPELCLGTMSQSYTTTTNRGSVIYDLDKRFIAWSGYTYINSYASSISGGTATCGGSGCDREYNGNSSETVHGEINSNSSIIDTQSHSISTDSSSGTSCATDFPSGGLIVIEPYDNSVTYDYTAAKVLGNPTSYKYDDIQLAQSDISASCAWWRYLSPGGEVLGNYLTGGDLEDLDELTGDIIYRAIHALGT